MLTTKPLLLAALISALCQPSAFAFTHTVSAGDTVTGETVDAGGPGSDNTQYVHGTANDTTVTDSGFQMVDGGVVNNSSLVNNGHVSVYNGGMANDTTVDSTSKLLIGDGGTANHSSVSGYIQNGGGTDSYTTVESGGSFQISSSSASAATSDHATIQNGATVSVFGDVNASDWSVAGQITVYRNIDDTVDAVFSNTTVSDGAIITLNYNAVMNDTVLNGGAINVQSTLDGTTASLNNTQLNGGTVTVNQNGAAHNTTMDGGLMTVYGGGLADNTLMNNGMMTVSSFSDDTAVIRDTTQYGGSVSVGPGGEAWNSVVNGGTLTNTAGLDTGTIINNGGRYTLNGTDATTTDITVNSGGVATLTDGTLAGTAVIEGGLMNVASATDTASADMTVQNDGTLYLADSGGAYQFGDTTLDGGNVSFAHDTAYSTLTLNSLSGNGTFYMNTDIAGGNGDYLSVTGNADGNFGVFVQDTGRSPTSGDSLTLINTGGGSGNFSLANTGGVVDLGTYEYHLVIDGDHQWSLATKPGDVDPLDPTVPVIPPDPGIDPIPPVDPVIPPVDPVIPPVAPAQITPSTAAVLNMATVDPLAFRAELASVRHRLEETRGFSHDTRAWVDVINTRNDVSTSAGAGFDQSLNGITLGIDRSLQREHGVTTQGLFFSYSHSDVAFDRGGDGNVDSYSLGGYASYLDNNGAYIDGIIKGNRFENDVNARMTSGGAADGYYDTNGIGAHIEAGRYFHRDATWFKPYAALTAFTTDNSEYNLSNGMNAHVGNERSVQAEAGLTVGHTVMLENGATLQPYASVAVTQEFIDDNRVDVNDDGHFTNDLSGTRGVYEFGLRTQVTDRMTAHVNASYASGAGVESPWVANAGVAWSF